MKYFKLVSFRFKLAVGLLLIVASLLALVASLGIFVWIGVDDIPWWLIVLVACLFMVGLGLVIWDRIEYTNEILVLREGLPHVGRISNIKDAVWLSILLPYRDVTIEYQDQNGVVRTLEKKLLPTSNTKLLEVGDRMDVKIDPQAEERVVVPKLLSANGLDR
jgi:hypothetical protein